MRRLSALMSAMLLAAVLSVAIAPAASAQYGEAPATEAECTAFGGTWASSTCTGYSGDGTAKAVTGDEPGDTLPQVQDRVFEWAPTIIILFAAIAIFGFSLLLLAVGVRKGLGKLTMLVRRA